MALEVNVSDYFALDGIHIGIRNKFDSGASYVTGVNDHGHLVWETLTQDQLVEVREAPLSLTNDVARALLDALLRHYQGASDMHTVRADLLHERGRVDGLIQRVGELAATLATAIADG